MYKLILGLFFSMMLTGTVMAEIAQQVIMDEPAKPNLKLKVPSMNPSSPPVIAEPVQAAKDNTPPPAQPEAAPVDNPHRGEIGSFGGKNF